MEITDTCKCGAAFHAKSTLGASVASAWATWLNAHRKCRKDNVWYEVVDDAE